MSLQKTACCKVNFLLNVLGKRGDGFHELETILQPVALADTLIFTRLAPVPGSPVERRPAERATAESNPAERTTAEKAPADAEEDSLKLICDLPGVPLDRTNLIWRAAEAFFEAARIRERVQIELKKRIPVAAGLGGGSSDAAATLEGLNELFGQLLGPTELHHLAAKLGSDVPFFLQPCPALATGRGEHVVSLESFPALCGTWLVLVYPGFGIPTPWAYQQLSRFPEALAGKLGRAQRLIQGLQTGDLSSAAPFFYNSLEAPALEKYPLLAMIREFLQEQGAPVSLMSGSGSTVFGLFGEGESAAKAKVKVLDRFEGAWCEAVAV